MNRSEIEQLQDEIIGEAVLSILRENGPINNKAVVARLEAMKASEPEALRREAIGRVIGEVRDKLVNRTAHPTREAGGTDRSNVYPLFGENASPRISKKH